MTQLPAEIVEDVFDQVPMIDFKVRYGLITGFDGEAVISTNVFTNETVLGLKYSYSIGNLSASSGIDAHAWYGFLKNDDFNVSVFGWGYSPFMEAGYDFNDFLLSFRMSIDFKAQNTYMKGINYTKNATKYVGWNFTASIEQPLWKDNFLILGFRSYYTKFFYKSWISFYSFDRYLFYPEFFVSFVL